MVSKELLEEIKEQCKNTDCSECWLSVGIYQEGLDYTYYSCDIRKKPEDWDLEKERIKQTKKSKKEQEKAEKKAIKAKKDAEREARKKAAEEKPKKKRGRKKKEDK